MQWIPVITSTVGVIGTVTVAVWTIRAADAREARQRLHDVEIRDKQWRHDQENRNAQWQRDAEVRDEQLDHASAARQEARLVESVLAYAAAMKNQTRVCSRIAASFGITRFSRESIDLAEAERLLGVYEDERSVQFERLLFFATPDLQQRAREWQVAVWAATEIRHGTDHLPKDQFAAAMAAIAECRDEFYNCARTQLGIAGSVDPTPPHAPERPGPLQT